jgi:phosphoribosylformimino-5-aminoimidazole carboxamide ribotide isomerase
MRITPAVDIRGGLCVNLVQGNYERETVFARDPVAQAAQWFEQGAELVHIVDLDGAREGRLCVGESLRRLRDAGISFEVGGGIRNLDTIKTVLNAGAERVILGTAAHREPNLVAQATELFPDRIAAGIDAREGRVAVRGWLELTDTDASEFAVRMAGMGVSRIIYTDILSDGLMKGPNI